MFSGNIKSFSGIGLLLVLALSFNQCKVREKKHLTTAIAFYNVENLFDTINDPNVNDVEFLPTAKNEWTSERYKTKLSNIAGVISRIGDELVPGGPAVIGLCEIENRGVLQDLINTPPLDELGYDFVHYDSPDRRGIDLALLYQKDAFKVTNSTSNRLYMPGRDNFYSRDQLVVTGELYGDAISVIVNHWPSRYSGPEYREAAAKLSRRLSDSLAKEHQNAKIFIMGDFNDDPIDRSVHKILGAKSYPDSYTEQSDEGDLYNPMWPLFKEGIGSLAYRGLWNLFDQIIFSAPVVNAPEGWRFEKAKVYNADYLKEQDGPYAGYPFRTYAGGAYTGGYSDHFPVYLFLTKDK